MYTLPVHNNMTIHSRTTFSRARNLTKQFYTFAKLSVELLKLQNHPQSNSKQTERAGVVMGLEAANV